MGAPNRDAAVAASSFIVAQIAVATAPLPIVRAATKRRYRRCCPLLWRCCCHRNDVRGTFPQRCALPLCSARSVAPSHLRFAPSSMARSTHSAAPSHLQSLFEGWHGVVVRSLDRQGTAPRVQRHPTSAEFGQVFGSGTPPNRPFLGGSRTAPPTTQPPRGALNGLGSGFKSQKDPNGPSGGPSEVGVFFNTDIDVEFEGKDRC